MARRIYLIPGFFGFANVGDLRYFSHVRRVVEDVLAARGVEGIVHYVPTLPTSSIRSRTERLLEIIAGTATAGHDTIHLVGHSTGGLDARLLTTSGVVLDVEHEAEPYVACVRSVISVSTPHLGTPMAAFFTGLLGQKLLKLLSMLTLYGLRLGSLPLPALLAFAQVLPGADALIKGSIIDQIYRDLLKDFDDDRQQQLSNFLEDVNTDQSLLTQLTPDAMDLFNAPKREGIAYGCVVSRARPPGFRARLKMGLSPTDQAVYAVYNALYELAEAPQMRTRVLTDVQRSALVDAFDGDLPTATDNDAIVPTLSQVYGDIIYACWGDHLDLIGHFDDLDHDPSHIDWLKTLSNFDRRHFVQLWSQAVDYMLGAETKPTA